MRAINVQGESLVKLS